VEGELLEALTPLVEGVHLLVVEPLPDGPLPDLLKPLAPLLLKEEVEALTPPSVGRVPGGGQAHGIHPAGPGAVRIDPASLRGEEGTAPLLVVLHPKDDHRGDHVLLDRKEGVGLQELGGRDAQAPFEAQHVIGGKEDVYVGAAGVETGNPGVASEPEGVGRSKTLMFG
jgi:hypothetical protein